jgi:hypothetical protein
MEAPLVKQSTFVLLREKPTNGNDCSLERYSERDEPSIIRNIHPA